MSNREFHDFVLEKIRALASAPIGDLNGDTKWMHLGLDSVDLMGLLGTVEDHLAVELPDEAIIECDTIGSFVDYALSLSQ